MELEKIFNAIFDAEETYGANMINISINDKVTIINNNKEIAIFDTKNLKEEDINKIYGLCEYLSLGVV